MAVERQEQIGIVQRSIDPFRPGNERILALGIYNIGLQMSDPSLEQVKSAVKVLATMPPENRKKLAKLLNETDSLFKAGGITVEDPEALYEGLFDFKHLIDKVSDTYGETKTSGFSDRKKVAESFFNKIRLKKADIEMWESREVVKQEKDLQKRYELAQVLKEKVFGFVKEFDISFYDRDQKEIDPTWENLAHIRWSASHEKDGWITYGSFGINFAVELIDAVFARHELEKELPKLPTIDRERLEHLRLKFGAKAANLIMLSELVGQINEASLKVPEFIVMPADLYLKWKQGSLSDDELRYYFDWSKGLVEYDDNLEAERCSDIMVRSSAVFSEDGDKVTGAGIYDSTELSGYSTFEEFKEAVVGVYQSTEASKAQAYRRQNGILQEEQMGIIIQRYISSDYHYSGWDSKGCLNSTLAGVPELMEVTTGTSRNLLNRQQLNFFLGSYPDRSKYFMDDVYHFPPDIYKVRAEMPMAVGQLALILERIWGSRLQIEFIEKGLEMNLLQVRKLPEDTFAGKETVTFPNEKPIFSGASIGIGDETLDILEGGYDSYKPGAVLLSSNEFWTIYGDDDSLPREGAVIIASNHGRAWAYPNFMYGEGINLCLPGS
ncbi:MAG: hypothetical protein M1365_08935 [Actinobacteria bacterium]|nr:hypothetical protein [Actinomycetota bacterium]